MHRSPAQHAAWYELLPYEELSPHVLGLLATRDIGIYLAVTPDVVAGLAATVRACHDHGLRVGVWPMIEREHGRWPSVHNLDRFEAFVSEVRRSLDTEPHEIVLDLEPPIDALPALFAFEPRTIARYLRRGIPREAVRRFAEMAERFHADDIATLTAAFPLILADGSAHGWQRFFGTPVDTTPTSRVSAMLYTSIIEGVGRGRLSRADVVSLLAYSAGVAHRRYGARASVSLGAIDTGALGDEPTYRTVAELSDDVAVTKGAGIEHLVLFSLCGAMRRPPIEPWLDALVETEPAAAPALTPRAAVAAALVWSAARAMSAGHTLARTFTPR